MRITEARVVLMGLTLVAGCGGAEAPSSPPPAVTSPPPTVTSRAPATGAKPANPQAKSSAVAPKIEPAKNPIPPGAQLVGGSEPNFRILQRDERPELLAIVSSLNPGVNSSLHTVVTERPAPPAGGATPLPKGFTTASEAGFDPSGMPSLIRCEKDGALMALIPVGLAVQGADGTPTASPRHPIDVDAFYMDVYEVTVEKYQRFREATKGDKTPPGTPLNASFPLQPAVGINWRDAMQYAKWSGRELPTESEWEKAARGTAGFQYPWGDGRAIWERRREPGQLYEVGSFRTDESPFGVFDLAGNAREWCQDFFAEDAYKQAPAAGSPAARNWAGPRTDRAGRRVVKGNPIGWNLWAREGMSMSERSPHVGFRCVLRFTGAAVSKSSVAADNAATIPSPDKPSPAVPPAPAALPPKKSAF